MMLDVLYTACMLKRGIPASFVMLQFPGGVPGNSFALPDVDVVCSKETATGLPRFEKRTRSSVLQASNGKGSV